MTDAQALTIVSAAVVMLALVLIYRDRYP